MSGLAAYSSIYIVTLHYDLGFDFLILLLTYLSSWDRKRLSSQDPEEQLDLLKPLPFTEAAQAGGAAVW